MRKKTAQLHIQDRGIARPSHFTIHESLTWSQCERVDWIYSKTMLTSAFYSACSCLRFYLNLLTTPRLTAIIHPHHEESATFQPLVIDPIDPTANNPYGQLGPAGDEKKNTAIAPLRRDLCVSTHSLQQTAPRISYNNGYGDFSLLVDRRIYRQPQCLGAEVSERTKSFWTVVEELDGFCRRGAFPWFKLPKELRQKIIRLLLAPLSIYDAASKVRIFSVMLERDSIVPEEHEDALEGYNGDFQQHLEHKQERNKYWGTSDDEEEPLSSEKQAEAEATFYQEKSIRLRRSLPHPDRQDRFHFHFEPRYEEDSYFSDDMTPDLEFLEWLRNISNTSNVFRSEMKHELWSNSKIHLDGLDQLPCLSRLLKYRPAAFAAIKSLQITVSFPHLFPCAAQKLNFAAWCEGVAKNMILDALDIHLDILKEELIEMMDDESQKQMFSITRQLHVKKNFNFTLIVDCSNDWEFYWDDVSSTKDTTWVMDENPYKTEELTIREWMLPDSLRVKTDTETERYIQARLE
ncbi:hypothetical protein VTL71DRAFT_4311 [Oculimacula yallundae]|uniref:F-box domain-containing protein n=1 Tax=Oculimacula yallundae TaxID=86028 RepID=A0ABR4C670_9HELO